MALLAALLAGFAADRLVLSRWHHGDGWIVLLGDVSDPLYETIVDEEEWETVRRKLSVQLLTGVQKGLWRQVEVEHLAGSALQLHPGRRYILMRDTFEDGSEFYSVSDVYRMPYVVGMLVFTTGMLLSCAGVAGLRALMGLLLSLAVLLFGYVPALLRGVEPVPFAILTAAVVSACTVLCVVRRRRYRLIAFLGTVGGALAASLTGALMVWLWQLTGLAGEGGTLLASTFPGLSLRGFMLAAVIIGSIGAVMDVAISVTSALAEIGDYADSLDAGALWRSGLGVGREVLGSMINTLVLAYLGSSLPITVLIASTGPTLRGLLNDPAVAEELARSLAGTVGLLLTVPITTAVAVWHLRHRR
ncbi:YibE/F family protein [Aminithiophilus ramosus]|uniref:YibE/F family protein n=2 Tax=Synergistales TaxID=649776 RepID=A0A9Q7EV66_9BACT|nr:YibE/F family protein [Aminithiophilus ramosus]QTX32243.1 YibE/F family protein [Aminithiophilus ramosus]QVL36111.1 YibE/F family protein [Synergistota bacterium]